jgi:hypothetical protein
VKHDDTPLTNAKARKEDMEETNKSKLKLITRGGRAFRLFNKAHRLRTAVAGLGEKPTLYCLQSV